MFECTATRLRDEETPISEACDVGVRAVPKPRDRRLAETKGSKQQHRQH